MLLVTPITESTDLATLVGFVEAVKGAMSRVEEGSPLRFGRHKVFIAALDPSRTTARLLWEAHCAGLIELTRADLTPAMNAQVMAASEIAYMNATFHFISLR